ncbi:hypothetical protein B9Z65_5948 [Elsinoe australis]|uniref:very-long-chain enoyl-CoA reductase n=1 Tax=Elsinoe australis TaxID=40998 RepID=A0A2P7YJJ3_9PEZI|nr:hypothetical protein B9Z65_5948 [Elsinoe australis]
MASKPIALVVEPRGKPIKKLPTETSVYLQASTSDLYHRLGAEAGISPDRIRVTKGSDGSLVPNAKDFTVERTGLRNKSVIYVKDLGPQIAWQTVFLIEYVGPLLIHPLIYFLRPYIFKNAGPASQAQTLSCVLITLHFLKRELETLLVHRFSNATMPARNIFKNSAHYWILAGANIAFWVNKPGSPTENLKNPLVIYSALALFIAGELGNLSTHLTLRGLRSAGGKERGIPQGLGFNLVTCPNYTFETIAWAGMWLMTFSLSTGLFVIIAVGQMYLWALKKEKRYRKEFGDRYKKKRCTMIPFVA